VPLDHLWGVAKSYKMDDLSRFKSSLADTNLDTPKISYALRITNPKLPNQEVHSFLVPEFANYIWICKKTFEIFKHQILWSNFRLTSLRYIESIP
jgi:hypothetical protein